MRILIAPDKFKDALDAEGVAAAVAEGVRDADPQAEIVLCPLADGGEGTGRILARICGATPRGTRVVDPLGRERAARWWAHAQHGEALIEMAEASGLWLLHGRERNAAGTTSYGTGQLIRAALDADCQTLTLCVGGSATVDGGAGCLQAMGWTLRDVDGNALMGFASGGRLLDVAGIEPPAAPPPARFRVLCDVVNPLLGPRGAAPVFAPQKGASAAQTKLLADALAHWCRLLRDATGRDVGDVPRGGAAGGLPATLLATYDAELVGGFDEVARRVGLPALFDGCDLCLTGEGRVDSQTREGKVVAGVAELAGKRGVPVAVFAGAVELNPGGSLEHLARALGVETIRVITPRGQSGRAALEATRVNLSRSVACYLSERLKPGV